MSGPRHPGEHEPDCAECGESYDPDDRTWSADLEDYVCPPCADRLGLLP